MNLFKKKTNKKNIPNVSLFSDSVQESLFVVKLPSVLHSLFFF